MTTTADIFGSGSDILEEVILLPNGSYTTGSYNLPAGYKKSDFEYIEGSVHWGSSGATGTSESLTKVNKDQLLLPTTSMVLHGANGGYCQVNFNSKL